VPIIPQVFPLALPFLAAGSGCLMRTGPLQGGRLFENALAKVSGGVFMVLASALRYIPGHGQPKSSWNCANRTGSAHFLQ